MECTYRKMQCNAGHFSRAFAVDEVLPRRCPVCNQPYDRRYNRPILCYEDGSVPEVQADSDCLETAAQAAGENMEEKAADTEILESPGRGRRVPPQNPSDDMSAFSRRRSGIKTNPASGKSDGMNPGVRSEQSRMTGKRVVLFSGGCKITIPDQGGYVGREELGKECFAVNPLISRRHAYVRVDHFGNLEVKDAGSLNGTYVDDGNGRRRLEPEETAMLKAGNTLWIANQVLAVQEDNVC